jgi:hypothetical protein
MPKVSDAFPSKHMKANVDVPEEGQIVLTIRDAEMVAFDDGNKIVLYFNETDKGFVVNKTNSNTLVNLLKSDDTDDWVGHRIALFSTEVEYGGKMVPAIRVRSRLPKDTRDNPNTVKPAAKSAIKPAVVQQDDDEDDSDIPF